MYLGKTGDEDGGASSLDHTVMMEDTVQEMKVMNKKTGMMTHQDRDHEGENGDSKGDVSNEKRRRRRQQQQQQQHLSLFLPCVLCSHTGEYLLFGGIRRLSCELAVEGLQSETCLLRRSGCT